MWTTFASLRFLVITYKKCKTDGIYNIRYLLIIYYKLIQHIRILAFLHQCKKYFTFALFGPQAVFRIAFPTGHISSAQWVPVANGHPVGPSSLRAQLHLSFLQSDPSARPVVCILKYIQTVSLAATMDHSFVSARPTPASSSFPSCLFSIQQPK